LNRIHAQSTDSIGALSATYGVVRHLLISFTVITCWSFFSLASLLGQASLATNHHQNYPALATYKGYKAQLAESALGNRNILICQTNGGYFPAPETIMLLAGT
jgi:hypothetical protein